MEDSEDIPDEFRSEYDAIDEHLAAMVDYIKRETRADTVQIIITKHNVRDGRSQMYAKGAGNHYARERSCEIWLIKQDP